MVVLGLHIIVIYKWENQHVFRYRSLSINDIFPHSLTSSHTNYLCHVCSIALHLQTNHLIEYFPSLFPDYVNEWSFSLTLLFLGLLHLQQGPHEIYRVFRKNCVFITIHLNPYLAYIAVRNLQSSQRNAIVYRHSYWLVIFCTTNSSRVLARGR